MSKSVLSADSVTRPHTLQDDMESLLYVVLYCGFLWLPHNLSKEDLAYTIKAFFESSYWEQGNIQGGRGKLANALRRQYTANVEFNEHLKVWLDTVMDYYYPTLESNYCGPSRWSSPDDLEGFWSRFLQTHDLPCNDRTVHDHPHATDKYESPEGSACSASTEAISLGKRGSEEDHYDEVPVVEKYISHPSHYSTSTDRPTQPKNTGTAQGGAASCAAPSSRPAPSSEAARSEESLDQESSHPSSSTPLIRSSRPRSLISRLAMVFLSCIR